MDDNIALYNTSSTKKRLIAGQDITTFLNNDISFSNDNPNNFIPSPINNIHNLQPNSINVPFKSQHLAFVHQQHHKPQIPEFDPVFLQHPLDDQTQNSHNHFIRNNSTINNFGKVNNTKNYWNSNVNSSNKCKDVSAANHNYKPITLSQQHQQQQQITQMPFTSYDKHLHQFQQFGCLATSSPALLNENLLYRPQTVSYKNTIKPNYGVPYKYINDNGQIIHQSSYQPLEDSSIAPPFPTLADMPQSQQKYTTSNVITEEPMPIEQINNSYFHYTNGSVTATKSLGHRRKSSDSSQLYIGHIRRRSSQTSVASIASLSRNIPTSSFSNGIEYITFVYTEERRLKEYTIRADTENVNLDDIPIGFRNENSIYNKANVPREGYIGKRWEYENNCNQLGWKLCWLNQTKLCGSRGLIQRAVDAYRNLHPETRSRRVTRAEKVVNGTLKTRSSRHSTFAAR